MKAIGAWRALPASDPSCLIEQDVPDPQTGPGDILVRVEAIGMNPADVRMRLRKENDGTFVVLGWDIAGEVVGIGPEVRDFSPGDAVFYAGDLTRSGSNSELHVVDAALVGRRPNASTPIDAAALPLTALTAWEVLFDRFDLPEPGEGADDGRADERTLLVVGGAGGMGSMTIQLARLVPGLMIIATALRSASRDRCFSLGADAVIDHSADMVAEMAAQNLPAPNLILIAADPDAHFDAIHELIAPQGRICCLAPFATPPDVNALMRKSVSLIWEFVFSRAMFATPDRARQGAILNRVAGLIDAPRITPPPPELLGPIDARTLRDAHVWIEGKRTIAKLVLAGFSLSSQP